MNKIKIFSRSELNALVRCKAEQHNIRCGERIPEIRWNQIINKLDRLEPGWRGYSVPETTGANWKQINGDDSNGLDKWRSEVA